MGPPADPKACPSFTTQFTGVKLGRRVQNEAKGTRMSGVPTDIVGGANVSGGESGAEVDSRSQRKVGLAHQPALASIRFQNQVFVGAGGVAGAVHGGERQG